MRKLVLVFLLSVSAVNCAVPKAIKGRSTANLTTSGINALHTTEAIKYLDIIRDTAIDGLMAKIISESTSTKIVKWHKAALLTIQQLPNGWSATTISGLKSLKDTLTPSEVSILGPYIDSAVDLITTLGV